MITKVMRKAGWIGFAVFFLVFFTVLKIPEARLKNFIQGTLASELAASGISMTSASSSLSMAFGLKFKMKEVNLMLADSPNPIKLSELSFSPSIFPLLVGKFGGTLVAYQGKSKLWLSFTTSTNPTSPYTNLSFEADEIDVGKTGILAALAQIQGSGVIHGSGNIKGDFTKPSSLEGKIDLKLSKVLIDQQAVSGFAIPRLTVSEGFIEGNFAASKLTATKVSLGKNAEDDLKGTVTGDLSLGQRWDMSSYNLKIKFSLSEKVLQAFAILDAILGSFKQADGSYGLTLTGPFTAPLPGPL